jgi:hypothetical protein
MDYSWVQPLLEALARGDDPSLIVPDDYIVVRGSVNPLLGTGAIFCGAMGRTILDAGAGVPHNQLRLTTAGAIRRLGGKVAFTPEVDPRTGRMNVLHVDITEGTSSAFTEPIPNPVPKSQRLR